MQYNELIHSLSVWRAGGTAALELAVDDQQVRFLRLNDGVLVEVTLVLRRRFFRGVERFVQLQTIGNVEFSAVPAIKSDDERFVLLSYARGDNEAEFIRLLEGMFNQRDILSGCFSQMESQGDLDA
ncbi:hypothetical protein C4K03_4748 [Pseudomonas synxantha]|uniref:Uncharacterized protein n=1 Tax=Pseudomonas synxantha TaxID=47883 RepID=A0A3G7UEC1_9PSED|nr:hypothetical protein [Pseudomonas synxantha]AZE56886.1 hypothetical protein C4K03_4748 [Pseudomonas synxantha]